MGLHQAGGCVTTTSWQGLQEGECVEVQKSKTTLCWSRIDKIDLQAKTVSFHPWACEYYTQGKYRVAIPYTNVSPAEVSTVGDSYLVRPDGTTKVMLASKDPMIYHHKWMFVAPDYDGFDYTAAWERSKEWQGLKGIDKSRIGRKSYWVNKVLVRLG